MKLQERIIIYTAYSMIYFIMGYIFLSVAMLFTKALFKMPLLIGVVMAPFMIAFGCGTAMIFVQAISSLLKVILSFADSKLLFDIQGKIYKLNDFVKRLPKYLNKIYLIAFFCYWFFIIIIGDILAFKEKNYSMLLFSVPFILVGIFMAKKNLKK